LIKKEKFEDAKEAIKNSISKKDIVYTDQKKKDIMCTGQKKRT